MDGEYVDPLKQDILETWTTEGLTYNNAGREELALDTYTPRTLLPLLYLSLIHI